jgi:lysophospholipase L1-like esterase
LVITGLLAAGCGGDDGDTAGGGTVPLFGGTVPPGGPALDLTPSGSAGDVPTVVMVGDSITVAAAPLIVAAAATMDVDLDVEAEIGRRIASGSTPAAGTEVLAEVLASTEPDLVVVALGTNDVGKFQSADEYTVPIEELLAVLPDDVPVAWIDTYLSRLPEDSATFNAALVEALTERGLSTVGRWSSRARDHGMLSDGVHPSEEGTQEFADLVVSEIETWVG